AARQRLAASAFSLHQHGVGVVLIGGVRAAKPFCRIKKEARPKGRSRASEREEREERRVFDYVNLAVDDFNITTGILKQRWNML
ncbi:MAG: hypothetical protein K2I40_05235, partial [Bifidobacterium castoris]|nr:hypothetical protein [Bifidobacterium castoris]